jgi:hypothetical protein
MSEYKIERWDGVMFSNSITKYPMIYIKPDITFLEFIKENNYTVLCEIKGTNKNYDNRVIPGIVDKSSNTPNCRPNFYEKTGLYVITLQTQWDGYPYINSLGTVIFKGLNGKVTDNEYKKDKEEKLQQILKKEVKKININYNLLYLLIFLVFIFLIIIYIGK